MKNLLLLLSITCCSSAAAQFAVITDQDGFVNVRKGAGSAYEIIDTLRNGSIVYCFETENDWLPVDYHLSRDNESGFIHSSRVKYLSDYKKLTFDELTSDKISLWTEGIRLTITTTDFNPKAHTLQYHKVKTSSNEYTYLEKINGKPIWGTDGNVPKRQYKQVVLEYGDKKIDLPIDNLFEPNLHSTLVYLDSTNKIIYIAALNSDGAGGYAALWIIEQGKFKERITTIPF